MLSLLAYAPDERWAYVREEGRHLLLRPPYLDELEVSEADVERSVTVQGYATSELTFATRKKLHEFLDAESVRVWRQSNPEVDLSELRTRLLAQVAAAGIDTIAVQVGEDVQAV